MRLSGRPQGFQRAEAPKHVQEIREFFNADVSKTNSSPTAILVGVSPDATDRFQLFTADGTALETSAVGRDPVLCDVVIDFEPWEFDNQVDIVDEIDAVYQLVRPTLSVDDDEDFEVVDDQATSEDNTVDDEDFESTDDSTEEEVAATAESESADAYFASLTATDLSSICESQEYRSWTDDRKERLLELLRDERKPGLIIDGQHRVSATKDLGEIPFLVSLLPNASWAELAFQFIVNNSSAKKVDNNLLFAIVGQSLDSEQLATIDSRLNKSGIKVSLIKASMRVQLESNPFQNMLKTNTPGDPGFLDATAMQKKVITLWYGSRGRSGQNPTWKKFRAISGDDLTEQSREFSMSDLFIANCPGSTRLEQAEAWQSSVWFDYFSAFWAAVQQKYETDGLWPRTRNAWPTARVGGSTSPDQRRVQSLMGATILGLLQVCLLQAWAERRFYRRDPGQALNTMEILPSEFQKEISLILEPLSSDFFLSYRRSGPDASKEVRQAFIRAAMSVLKEVSTVADIKKSSPYFND